MKFWNGYDMMRMCQYHDLYTKGDSYSYEAMLHYVDHSEPTPEAVNKVATDIVCHSAGLTLFDDGADMREIKSRIRKEVIKDSKYYTN